MTLESIPGWDDSHGLESPLIASKALKSTSETVENRCYVSYTQISDVEKCCPEIGALLDS